MSRLVIMITALYSAAFPAGAAADCTATSGPQRVAVLELYTSEGCDSCSSADKWVSELPARKLTSERVVALAFHVDYWNELGWVDRFSQPLFSARQRDQSRRRGASFVYTPQLLLNGRDYRRALLFDDFESKVKALNQQAPQAQIRVKLVRSTGALDSQVDVHAESVRERHPEVYLALYENNLATAVKGGENRGRVLTHDFVVRELVGPLALDDKGRLSYAHEFAVGAGWKPQDLHVAAFVQDPRSGDVLQALAAACR